MLPMTVAGFWDLASFAETRGELLASRAEAYQMRASSKFAKAAMIGLGVLVLGLRGSAFSLARTVTPESCGP